MLYHKKSFSRDIYYCRRKDDLSCKARVSIDQKTGLIVSWISEHCHDNDLAQQKIKQLVSKEIDRALRPKCPSEGSGCHDVRQAVSQLHGLPPHKRGHEKADAVQAEDEF